MPQIILKSIKNFFFLTLFFYLTACRPTSESGAIPNPQGKILLPSGKILDVKLALTIEEQRQGLSGVRPHQFKDYESLLFFNLEDGPRTFWMPDTYFNLDIIFLDKNLTVVDIERNVPFHNGRSTPPPIPTTRTIYSRHVLEIKSSSPLSLEIHKGLTLKWISEPSLSQIESKIRQER